MRPARGVLVAGSIGVMVGLGLGGALKATPAEGQAPRPVVVVDCPAWAEDTAAHLRLVSYTPERAVYVCERRGY